MEWSSANNLLFFIRFILVVLPYPGYIHPDEYFQSPEVMADEVLNLKSHLTWEWTESFPIRNILHPVMSSGIPFWLLSYFHRIFKFHYTAELLLVFPRLFSLFCICLTEKCFPDIFQHSYADRNLQKFCLFLYRSSYVAIVVMTRTFSNSFEALTFAFYILLIIRRMRKVELVRLLDTLFGLVIAAGFFIRPTFLCFALYPTFFIFGKLFLKARSLLLMIKFMLFVFSGFILGACIMLISDHSFYSMKTDGISWPITPVNFILYNTNKENLKLHGLHPKYLHIFVNMFLILGPLYIVFIKIVVNMINGGVHPLWHFIKISRSLLSVLLPASNDYVYEIRKFIVISTVIPVCILSLFAHQEPRFLLPLFLPIIFIVSFDVYSSRNRSKWVIAWLIFNLVCVIWYGILHQSGVYKSLSYMNMVLVERTGSQEMHLIYWHTYMVPRHLLGEAKSDNAIAVHDLGGGTIDVLKYAVDAVLKNSSDHSTKQIWLFCPSSLHRNVTSMLPFKLQVQFHSHVSMEDFPLNDVITFLRGITLQTPVDDYAAFWRKMFSLNAYVL